MCIDQMEGFRKKDLQKRVVLCEGCFGPVCSRSRCLYLDLASLWRNTLAWVVGLQGIKQLEKILYRLISRFYYRLFGKNENVCDFR